MTETLISAENKGILKNGNIVICYNINRFFLSDVFQCHLRNLFLTGEDMHMMFKSLVAAACAIKNADTIVILAGAGMSVDSGLPLLDDDSPEGLWSQYPELRRFSVICMKQYARCRRYFPT